MRRINPVEEKFIQIAFDKNILNKNHNLAKAVNHETFNIKKETYIKLCEIYNLLLENKEVICKEYVNYIENKKSLLEVEERLTIQIKNFCNQSTVTNKKGGEYLILKTSKYV